MGSSRRFCSSSSDECRAGQSGSPCRRGSALVGGPCLTASKLSRSHEDGPAGRCPTSFMSVMGSRAAIRPIRSSSCQRVKTSSSCESLCSRVLTTALYQSHAWSRTSGELASCAFLYRSSRMNTSTGRPVSAPSRPTLSSPPREPTSSNSSAVRRVPRSLAEERLRRVRGKRSGKRMRP